ncbi:hypothetical protein [Nocardioides sp. TF02-7]|uniref:hypothetical protein n=1 Tax=Nocardioides sp. TF02-7 TaxID=2917724 RepID=UPI001F05B3FB|nr:hypothetical protein [Nocardioides sp. TF02-7]UMG93569.1 hypothetical protein MF408_05090 [Nocardioides sp. TF02-7]
MSNSNGETLVVSRGGAATLSGLPEIKSAHFVSSDQLMIQESTLAIREIKRERGTWSVQSSSIDPAAGVHVEVPQAEGSPWHFEQPLEVDDGYVSIGDSGDSATFVSELANVVLAQDIDALYRLDSSDSTIVLLVCDPDGVAIVKGSVSSAAYSGWQWHVVCQRRDFSINDSDSLATTVLSNGAEIRVIVADTSAMSVLGPELEELGRIEIGGGAARGLHITPRLDDYNRFNFALQKRAGLIIGEFLLE